MISLIVPVYNKAPFLRRCLDSIANQTNKSAQVIIIDDGSTDGSGKICDEYKKYGFEVHHTKNKGVSMARNLGIKYATGDYITFMDADDSYEPEAVDVMTRIAAKNVNNIVQFGHYRHLIGHFTPVVRNWGKGTYHYTRVQRQWVGVWNKMYKSELIKPIKFVKGMQFGEDEMFNIECLLKNGDMYHAPQNLMHHYFDDKESLCRKDNLPKERLEGLIKALEKKKTKLSNQENIEWINKIIQRHYNSPTFKNRNYYRENAGTGKYDIVYFVKDCAKNEELRYSLRSVEQNLKYRNVVFYGGCPDGLHPDRHYSREQTEPSKWERVRGSLRAACLNDELTEDFWLFNDDFFILKPMSEKMPPQYNGELHSHIEKVERRHNREIDWTRRLKHLCQTLENAGKSTLNYAVHKPILINRKKALEVLDKFPDEPLFRALYGNYWEIGGESKHDMKCIVLDYPIEKIKDWEFLSTQDDSFERGTVGKYLKEKFTKKSRFET